MRRARALVAIVIGLSAFAGPARADGPPALVLVIEASGTRIDAARLRAGVSAALGIPTISIIERTSPPTVGVLAIAVTEGGRRAAIQYLPTDGPRFAMIVDVRATGRHGADGTWLVEPCVATVRSSDERRAAREASPDLVDPWIASHALPGPAGTRPGQTIDPWAGLPRAAPRVWVIDYHVDDEVENPWAEAVSRYREEQRRRIEPPRRTR